MKKYFPTVALLACGLLGAGEFSPGGVSVDLDSNLWRNATPAQPAKNYGLNGSFEEPGTDPNGHQQTRQKHWRGFANIGNGKNPVSREYRKDISGKIKRKTKCIIKLKCAFTVKHGLSFSLKLFLIVFKN